MILTDTSIWVDPLRKGHDLLSCLLERNLARIIRNEGPAEEGIATRR